MTNEKQQCGGRGKMCKICGGNGELSMGSPLYTEECPDCEGTGDETDGT